MRSEYQNTVYSCIKVGLQPAIQVIHAPGDGTGYGYTHKLDQRLYKHSRVRIKSI